MFSDGRLSKTCGFLKIKIKTKDVKTMATPSQINGLVRKLEKKLDPFERTIAAYWKDVKPQTYKWALLSGTLRQLADSMTRAMWITRQQLLEREPLDENDPVKRAQQSVWAQMTARELVMAAYLEVLPSPPDDWREHLDEWFEQGKKLLESYQENEE